METEKIATTKIYGHDELHIPVKIKKRHPHELSKGTIIDWYIEDDLIILKPRQKISIEDVMNIL